MAVEESPAQALALVWEESRSQVDEQRSSLEALRNRSIAVLSVASIVAGLFGAQLIHRSLQWRASLIAVALVAFGVSVGFVLAVVYPKAEWEFYQDVGQYLDDYRAGKPVTTEDAAYNLARSTEASWCRNEEALKSVHFRFKVVCILLAVQVVAWAATAL